MSRVKTLALTMAVLFALAGCAQLFDFNLFGAIDNPPTPTAAEYEGSDGLDKLDEDLDSPAIVDAMSDAVVAEIANNLWTDYLADGVSGDEDGQAAIVYADLALKTTEGEQLVNNIVDTITTLMGGGTPPDPSDLETLIAGIIPPEALADEDTFTSMVLALLAANDAYLALGAYVDAGNDLPPGSMPGDIAQKALVAWVMAVTVQAVLDDPDMAPITEDGAAVQLFLLLTDATTDPRYDADIETVDPPDPYATMDPGIQALLDLGMPF